MARDVYALMREIVVTAVRSVVPDVPDEIAARVEVTPPRDPFAWRHGDERRACRCQGGASAACETCRCPLRTLRRAAVVVEASAAGPGFVNLRLDPGDVSCLAAGHPAHRRSLRRQRDRAGTRINVEYVSANPTGPMHIGHCRGAVVGDALANLLAKAGYDVTKEYYINDAGAQVTALAWAAYWRYLQAIGTPLTEEDFPRSPRRPAIPRRIPDPDRRASGGTIRRLAGAAGPAVSPRRKSGSTPCATSPSPRCWRRSATTWPRSASPRTCSAPNARWSTQRRRRRGDRPAARAQGLIYEGVLEPPKGKTPDDWEPRPQTLFRATQFGDDVDRPLRKSDGSNTYFANDIAYHADKIDARLRRADRRARRRPWRLRQADEAAVKALSGNRPRRSRRCSARWCAWCAAASRCACRSAPAPT